MYAVHLGDEPKLRLFQERIKKKNPGHILGNKPDSDSNHCQGYEDKRKMW